MQDITNLRATLDALDIMYELKKTPLEIKSDGKYHVENVDIPIFSIHQFLGRICMMLEELQAKFTLPNNEGLIPSCRAHGHKPPVMVVEGRAFCVICLANGPFAEFACDWVSPEEGGDDAVN